MIRQCRKIVTKKCADTCRQISPVGMKIGNISPCRRHVADITSQEASDAAGNIGRDQCRVIIVPHNMMIQEVDVIIQKSTVRYPVAATADLGVMLETKTNLLLRYIHDSSQALFNKIDATQYTTNRARERGLMEAGDGEVRASTMLNEYMRTNSNMTQR
jgi:hypothetical protein